MVKNFTAEQLKALAHIDPNMLGVNERMGLKLFGREIIKFFEEFQPIDHGT